MSTSLGYVNYALCPDDAAGWLTVGARTGSCCGGMPTSRSFNVAWLGANRCSAVDDTAEPDQAVEYVGSELTVSAK